MGNYNSSWDRYGYYYFKTLSSEELKNLGIDAVASTTKVEEKYRFFECKKDFYVSLAENCWIALAEDNESGQVVKKLIIKEHFYFVLC